MTTPRCRSGTGGADTDRPRMSRRDSGISMPKAVTEWPVYRVGLAHDVGEDLAYGAVVAVADLYRS
jgi:hypothetical protein